MSVMLGQAHWPVRPLPSQARGVHGAGYREGEAWDGRQGWRQGRHRAGDREGAARGGGAGIVRAGRRAEKERPQGPTPRIASVRDAPSIVDFLFLRIWIKTQEELARSLEQGSAGGIAGSLQPRAPHLAHLAATLSGCPLKPKAQSKEMGRRLWRPQVLGSGAPGGLGQVTRAGCAKW